MRKLTADLLVIGGGAAGLMAAGTAAELYPDKQIMLLERNPRLGVKLLITGKGRCNVTNNCTIPEVLQNIPRNPRFLQSALHGFTPQDVMSFFESLGVPLKTERGNRVFPQSDASKDIVEALKRWTAEQGVSVCHGLAKSLIVSDGQLQGVHLAQGDTILTPRVLIATGGCSYPRTGSDGSGYLLARQAGHDLVEPQGSLVPLQEAGEDCARMQGLSLRNVGVRLCDGQGKTVYSDFGELLFTHFGLSGPTVLSASAHMRPDEHYTLCIDLKPALDEQTLDKRLLREFDTYKNRNLETVLHQLYPSSLVPVALRRIGMTGEEKVHSVTKAQRRAILELTKHFTISIEGKRPVEEAIVTSGGVDVRQVHPKTMKSKLMPGLSFAGEVLDVDAYTGGFNLQIAWSTGRAAGIHAFDEE